MFKNILESLSFENVLKFNHNHFPKGDVKGGQFTSAYQQAVDARGKPMYDKYGKAVHALDKNGNKIPKNPGEVILSESHDSTHANSKRTKPAKGTSRDKEAIERIGKQITEAQSLSTRKNLAHVQQLGAVYGKSNLKNAKDFQDIYLLASESQHAREGVDSRPPTETQLIAALTGQLTKQSVKHFESNLEGGHVGVSKAQSHKEVMSELTKDSVEKAAKAAGKEPIAYLQDQLKEQFAKSEIKPIVAATSQGYGISFPMTNGNRADQDRVASFNQTHELTQHPKHWNGVEKTINVRDGAKMLNDFAKANPDHKISKKWAEMKSNITDASGASNQTHQISSTQTLTTKAFSFMQVLKKDGLELLRIPFILPSESDDDFESRLKKLGFSMDDVEAKFNSMYPITPTYYTRSILSSVGDPIFEDASDSN